MDKARQASTKLLFDFMLVFVVILFLVTSYQFAKGEGAFARVIGYPVACLAVGLMVADVRNLLKSKGVTSKFRIDLPIVPLIYSVVYIVAIVVIGFNLATLLFITGLPLLLSRNYKRIPMYFVLAVVVTALFVFLFKLGSGVVLPGGLLGGIL